VNKNQIAATLRAHATAIPGMLDQLGESDAHPLNLQLVLEAMRVMHRRLAELAQETQ
jgi:hypothetical protein